MKEEVKSYISPLVSFDIYLENYHKLLKLLRKEADVKQLKSILKSDIATHVQDLILHETYDALVLTRPDQHIVWVNEGFQEMTGYSKSFAIGKRPSFLQGPLTSKNSKQEIRELLRAEHTFTGSILNYRKNGEIYTCQIKIIPLYDSKKELTHFIAMEKELLAA
ncbi:PAS domain-containing protein [Muricauda sp. 334s03]|uniref:PAS domain-containing protein n=1 Tax=Flagellimonas yonaguniensis TaxID=3031325 RepID=A0ABT5XYZ1_9FLAO|nr:PAS domain-containing protein [[Muricauda] yonaguniensis]MDF0716407.1 PAS domain-containing protein [[Muricauda] yonaguniensis]